MGVDASEATGPLWDDRPWHRLPAVRATVTADVCVVGLGGSGLSAVGELLDLGVDVVGIDAGRVGGAAAGRNGGFFLAGTTDYHHRAAAALGADRAAALYRLTLDQLHRIWLETPGAFRRTGSVRIATTQEEVEDCRAQMASMREASLPVEPYAGPEGYGLLFGMDGAGQPLRRCRQLAARARMRGARLHEDTPALDVAGERVVTPTGEVRCGAVIVAVDGSLERILPELAGRVRTARLQVLGTAPAIEVTIPRPVHARWGLDYWQQTPDKRVVLGGFRDVGGNSEWTARAEPSRPLQEQLTEFLRIGLGVTAPVTHRWAGCSAFTDDPLPILEEVRERVWALGAYNGAGNVLGAIWGRAAAQRIVTGSCLLDSVLPGVARTG